MFFMDFHWNTYAGYTQFTNRLQGVLWIETYKIQQVTQVTYVATTCKGTLKSFKYSFNLRNLLHFSNNCALFCFVTCV